MSRFFPRALHEYPFDQGEDVEVFAKDCTKIGGYTRQCKAEMGQSVFSEISNRIWEKERGNVNICGHIAARGVRWVIPVVGKNHVAFE